MSEKTSLKEPIFADYLARWSTVDLVAHEQERSAREEYATAKIAWLTAERDLYKGQAEINQRTIKEMAQARAAPQKSSSSSDLSNSLRTRYECTAGYTRDIYIQKHRDLDLRAADEIDRLQRELYYVEDAYPDVVMEAKRRRAEQPPCTECARYNNGRVILLNDIERFKITLRDLWRIEGECPEELEQRVKGLIGGG